MKRFLFLTLCFSGVLAFGVPISNVLGTGVTTGNVALVTANSGVNVFDGRFSVTGTLSNLSAATYYNVAYFSELNTGPNRWITPSGPLALVTNSGIYNFSTQFDLTGFDPNSATITGRWATDNCGELWVNGIYTGNNVGGGNGASCNVVSGNFTALTNFNVNSGNSTFNAGLNTLEFRLYNDFSVTGLLVTSVESNANATPEPGTCALVGIALTALGLSRRERHS